MSARETRNPGAPPVTLHVERLVLDGLGLTRAQGIVVQRAFERELVRLVTHGEHVAPWQSARVPGVSAATVRVDTVVRPSQLGRDMARSVYSTLRKSP